MGFNPYAPPKANLYVPTKSGEGKLFSFAGRMARSNYIVAIGAVTLPLGLIATWVVTSVGPFLISDRSLVIRVMLGLMMLGSALLPIMMLYVSTLRRIRDLSASRVWALLLFVPIVNMALVLGLTMWPGTQQSNHYGPPPITSLAPRIGAALVLFLYAVLGLSVAIR